MCYILLHTEFINEINNTQIDKAKKTFVMTMYNLIENSDNYSKTSGSLWLYDNATEINQF